VTALTLQVFFTQNQQKIKKKSFQGEKAVDKMAQKV
jgi:hypothetical protein